MNTLEILKNLQRDKYSNFCGVFAGDQLPKKIIYPCGFVVNTDTKNKKGEHWIAIYFRDKDNSIFFDPMGFSPKYHKFLRYLKQHSKTYEWNDQQIQGLLSINCGYFCVLFIQKISRNCGFGRFLKFFRKNKLFNDALINRLKQKKKILN